MLGNRRCGCESPEAEHDKSQASDFLHKYANHKAVMQKVGATD